MRHCLCQLLDVADDTLCLVQGKRPGIAERFLDVDHLKRVEAAFRGMSVVFFKVKFVAQYKRTAGQGGGQYRIIVRQRGRGIPFDRRETEFTLQLFLEGFQGRAVRFSHDEIQSDGAGTHSGNLVQQPCQPGTGPWPLAPCVQGLFINLHHHDLIGDDGFDSIGDDGVGHFELETSDEIGVNEIGRRPNGSQQNAEDDDCPDRRVNAEGGCVHFF